MRVVGHVTLSSYAKQGYGYDSCVVWADFFVLYLCVMVFSRVSSFLPLHCKFQLKQVKGYLMSNSLLNSKLIFRFQFFFLNLNVASC